MTLVRGLLYVFNALAFADFVTSVLLFPAPYTNTSIDILERWVNRLVYGSLIVAENTPLILTPCTAIRCELHA